VIRTLIVDDDYRVAGIHATYVDRVPGFTVVGKAHSAREVVQSVTRLRPDLVLLDLYLPDGHGLEVIHDVSELAAPQPDFIVITAARDVRNIRGAMRLGAVHYLVKPFGFAKLRDRLVAYRGLQAKLGQIHEASQDDVDALYATMRTPPTPALPKRHSAPTMALVRDAVLEAAADVSAAEVAAVVGVSRPTAQRYLSYLTRQGLVELHLRYGGPGRPEQRYRAGRADHG
jgi:response regulator of citrate/malate metabolism